MTRITILAAPLIGAIVFTPTALASTANPDPPAPPPPPHVQTNCCTQTTPGPRTMTWNGSGWVCPDGHSC